MQMKKIFPQDFHEHGSLPTHSQDMRPKTFIKNGKIICVGYAKWTYYLFHGKCAPLIFTFFTSRESPNVDKVEFLRNGWNPERGRRTSCDSCGKDLFS